MRHRSLQARVAFLVVVPALFSLIVFYLFFSKRIYPELQAIEEQSVIESTSRFKASLDGMTSKLLALGKLLAESTSVINIAMCGQGVNGDLGPLDVDHLSIYDDTGELIYTRSQHQHIEFGIPVADAGIIIQNASGSCPAIATLTKIMSGEDLIGYLLVGQSITPKNLDINPDCIIAVTHIEADTGTGINPVSYSTVGSGEIEEHLSMRALFGNQKVLIKATFPRHLGERIVSQFTQIAAFLFIVTVAVAFFVLYSMRKAIIVPVKSLSREIEGFTFDANSIGIDIESYPTELHSTISAINVLFSSVKTHQEDQRRAVEIIRESVIQNLATSKGYLEAMQGKSGENKEHLAHLTELIHRSIVELMNLIRNR